jgi:8-oxo-dGTP pyrophosphatase MutT (NUDIX family)
VIITAGDKVLLVKGWLSAGHWILPGGGTHKGEDSLVAARREVREETGVDIDPSKFKLIRKGEVSDYGISFKATVYKVELSEVVDLVNQKLEISDAIWADRAQLRDLSPLTARLLAE